MATVSTKEVSVADIPTKLVTFTGDQATVVREIFTTVQPGQNEVTIYGLDPKIDVDSIRIEGSGPATITDIQTQIIPRRENFTDVFPEDSDTDDGGDEDPDDIDYGFDDSELLATREQITGIQAKKSKAADNLAATAAKLQFLDKYGKSMSPETTDLFKVNDFLQLYTRQRSEAADTSHAAEVELREVENELEKLETKKQQLESKQQKAKKAALKDFYRAREEQQRARRQKRQQRERERLERRKFWTNNVGHVRVSLDSNSGPTPGSSRRNSVVDEDSTGEHAKPEADVTILLTYVLPGSHWAARYEMNINTPSSTAQMTCLAEFRNSSSETWRDTQVALSTSKASFSGLHERVPSLEAWHIQLDPDNASNKPSWHKILKGGGEAGEKPGPSAARKKEHEFQLMLLEQQNKRRLMMARQEQQQNALQAPQQAAPGGLFGSASGPAVGSRASNPFGSPQPVPESQPGSGLFGGARSLFGGSSNAATTAQMQAQQARQAQMQAQQAQMQAQQAQMQAQQGQMQAQQAQQSPTMLFSAMPPPMAMADTGNVDYEEDYEEELGGEEDDEEDEEDETALSPENLDHQDSVTQQYGLTTTHELPGRRTVIPSSVSRRHILAELDLESMSLSYLIVPKHRTAAFLRARIQNTSSAHMLRGKVGLSVDGTFLGAISMPSTPPNEFFSLSLGSDPAILVKYSKPTVRPASGSFFVKEEAAVFRRSCWIKNTRDTAVDVNVMDQVPLSEHDKLRVHILEPAGLAEEGDETDLDLSEDVGEGTAVMGKTGEIKWSIRLEPGKEVRTVLEYEARVPSGSEVGTSYG
ncbi:uncharacterized protein KD926_003730 [Aspergillus affinis]|uniref:uncharacterized protein n=1 Tax=Aspergillus affinis TaxID=1070780 RepID=UPI0022FEBDD3|nr:uncharacterized protein KD926_003730 [Aspergillus affinis]KAI9035340.1 hypothetical protein KD926_003730 [Aspergillus affinis]